MERSIGMRLGTGMRDTMSMVNAMAKESSPMLTVLFIKASLTEIATMERENILMQREAPMRETWWMASDMVRVH